MKQLSLRLILCLALAPVLSAYDPLAAHVTTYRDTFGVPHIVGDDDKAAFFGYGYAQAEDHLEDMMLQYRDAQGRRAEVQGMNALGDGYLQFIPYEYRWDGDYLQRLLRTKRCVVEHRDQIDPDTFRMLDGFSRGVNAYISDHHGRIPDWISPITPEDVEALERSNYLRFYSIHDALIKMGEKTFQFPNFGSNQWAILASRSANGHIIHVEHTHMPWANRFQNYEAHLIVPGKLDVAGISWFGSPVFLDGFNDHITWSATWNEPNISDVYEERLNPKNALQYLYDGQWRDVQVVQETFHVKGAGSGLETVTLPLYYTHHGPIVRYDPEKGHAYSVKLPNFEGVNYATGLYGIMKAQNLAEFKAAAARQFMPRWNLLYSDRENIFWVHNANVAERASGFDWSKPVPGWLKETEWGPYLPFNRYPQVQNPASGFLQNTNNPPWVCTRNSGLKPLDPAPYYLQKTPKEDAGEEVLNTRGERLFQVLGQPNKLLTMTDMFDLSFDTYIVPAAVIVPLIKRSYEMATPSASSAHALELIGRWDLRSSKDSVAYTYIHFWAQAYREMFSEAEFSRFIAYHRKQLVDIGSEAEQRKARAALEEAVIRIQKRYGQADVPWGKINVVVRGETMPLGGESIFGVLHPDEGVEQDDGTIHCNDGWGHLLVVEESQPKKVWSLLPYGESQHPESKHYNDMARLHSERRAKPFWFSPSDILAHTESVKGDPSRLRALSTSQPGDR